MEFLYLDDKLCVVVKPAGVLSTDEPGGLPELVRAALGKSGGSVRTVHRLDRAAGGVMVLARTRHAAADLSAQIREHRFIKEYLAVCHGRPEPERGTFTDLLVRDRAARKTLVAAAPGRDTQHAELDYACAASASGLSLVRIRLHTGRTHQIRAQFAARGLPLAGDTKYGAPARPDITGIALWSCRLAFVHPKTGAPMDFTAPPPDTWPWSLFPGAGKR